MIANEIESGQSVLEVLPMQVHLLGITILIYLSICFGHLCDEVAESIGFLFFFLGFDWVIFSLLCFCKSRF